jgi:hypothetical protein
MMRSKLSRFVRDALLACIAFTATGALSAYAGSDKELGAVGIDTDAQPSRGRQHVYATNKPTLFEMSDSIPGALVLDGQWGPSIWQSRFQGSAKKAPLTWRRL